MTWLVIWLVVVDVKNKIVQHCRTRLNRTLSDRTQSRMEALRMEAEAKKTEGCTFKPKVNTSSVRMVLEKQALQGEGCSSRYDKLYSDAQRRLEKQQVGGDVVDFVREHKCWQNPWLLAKLTVFGKTHGFWQNS